MSTWQAVRATRAERAAVRAEATNRLERDRALKAEGQATNSAKKAQTEAAVAKAVSDFLQNDLLAEAAPEKNARDKQVTVEALLKKAAATIEGKFAGQPEVEAAIRFTIGDTYLTLGLYPEGQPHLERSVELRRQVLGPENPETLEAMDDLAVLYQARGFYDQVEPLITQTLEVRRRVLGAEHPGTLSVMHNLASLYYSRGRFEDAERLYTQTLELSRRVLGPEHPDTLNTTHYLARIYKELRPIRRGPVAARQDAGSQTPRARSRASRHPPLDGQPGSGLHGSTPIRRGRAALQTAALNLQRRVLGLEHPDTLATVNNLAMFYTTQSRFDEAELLYVQGLEVSRRVLGVEHRDTLLKMHNLAMLDKARGRFDLAEARFIQTLEIMRRVLGRGASVHIHGDQQSGGALPGPGPVRPGRALVP